MSEDCTLDPVTGCIICPDIPPTPPVPGGINYITILGWNAGANSVDELDGDIEMVTYMSMSDTGAVVGFKQGRGGIGIPELITHGFVFQRGIDGLDLFGIVENGTTIMSSLTRESDLGDVFWITRLGGVVSYYVNSSVPGFDSPLYVSTLRSVGPCVVGGCLYASGDDIGDPTTFTPLNADDVTIQGTFDSTYGTLTMIATNVTGGAICFSNLEHFYEVASGSSVGVFGSLPQLQLTATDVDGAFIFSGSPVFTSYYSLFTLPPVYLISSGFGFGCTMSGYSVTTGTMSFSLPKLSSLATDISGALLISTLEKFTSPLTGDIPPVLNYFTLLQSPGFLDIAQDVQSPWAIIQEELIGSASLRADVGVLVVARAMAGDGIISRAELHEMLLAQGAVYANINQVWYGAIDAEAIAGLTLTEQVQAFASIYALCAASATPSALADMHLAITASVIALAGASGIMVYPLVDNATASVNASVVYGAVGQILAQCTASATVSQIMVFMTTLDAEAVAAVGATVTADQFAAAMDTAGAYVRTLFLGQDFEGWVLNTRPRGAADNSEPIRGFTTYQNMPFTSFANYQGKQYGASTGGVYELTGDTDDGEKIPAWIRTGLMDLDSRRDKRMQSVYVGYTSDKRLIAKMVTTTGGEKVETWYTMRAIQNAGDTRDGRIQIGKGLHSVYWAFELHNEDGADFTLDVVALWPVYLDRRVTNG